MRTNNTMKAKDNCKTDRLPVRPTIGPKKKKKRKENHRSIFLASKKILSVFIFFWMFVAMCACAFATI